MNRTKGIAAAVALALLAGCSTVPPQPQLDYSLVDPAGVDMARYQADFADCAALANQANVAGTAATGAAVMAGVGSVIGALLGAAICGHSCARQGALIGAASGVSSGATSGAAAAITDQQITLRNCLTGRGYRVIR